MSSRWNHDGGIHEIPLGDLAGRLWLCGKHVVGPDPEALLVATGADTIVCLTERHELLDRYPHYVHWLASDRRAVWFPIHDLHAPPVDEARLFLTDLVTRVRGGERLIVHCAAGIGRAGTTAVAMLVLSGWPLDDALTHVRAHRPMAGPEVGAQLELVRALSGGRSVG
jgi:protein-tyrosine phosphatase